MKSHLLFAFFFFANSTAFPQDTFSNNKTHVIRPLIQNHERIETPAYNDSALFSRYLNWALQNDSLPEQFKYGKPFIITVNYMVSKEGKITRVNIVRTNEDHNDI